MTFTQFQPTLAGQTKAFTLIQTALLRQPSSCLRYAYASTLASAASSAAADYKTASINELRAAHAEEVARGGRFQHEGYTFEIQRTNQYDFSGFGDWRRKQAAVKNAEERLRVLKKELAAIESVHKAQGNVPVTAVKEVLKFFPE